MRVQTQSLLRTQSPLPGRAAKAPPMDQFTLSDPLEVPPTPAPTPSRISSGLLAALSVAGLATGLAGCTPAPPNQAQVQVQSTSTKLSYAYMSAAEEIELGKQVAARVEKETPLWHNPAAQQRVQAIGQRLASDSSRSDIQYTFKLLDTPAVNAMALPGGTVYVTRGLYENYPDDGELMFVMGHEFGHVEQRHSIKQLEKSTLVDILGRAVSHGRGQTSQVLVGLGEKLLSNQFSQSDESEADRIGQAHLVHLGIDPHKAVTAMERLGQLTGSGQSSRVTSLIFSDHPPTQDRIEALRQGAAQYTAQTQTPAPSQARAAH